MVPAMPMCSLSTGTISAMGPNSSASLASISALRVDPVSHTRIPCPTRMGVLGITQRLSQSSGSSGRSFLSVNPAAMQTTVLFTSALRISCVTVSII